MKKITKSLSLLALIGSVSSATAQELTKQEGEHKHYERCSTTEYEAYLRQQDPKRFTEAQFEEWLAPLVAKVKADRLAGRNVQAVYNIPVVIHIVHNGDAVGTGENITDAQARSQINVMNQDYRRMVNTPGGANSTGLAVDVEINFCLAQTDPNGNLTTGIVRHNITPPAGSVAPTGDWETRPAVQNVKATTSWDPTLYLNMWTFRFGGLPLSQGGLSGLLGYAQFPSNSGLAGLDANGGAANTDGVVATYDAFGTIAENDGTFMLNNTYNLGRTMTHEVGHWLGLRHIWGEDSPGGCGSDDYCADTPNAASPNYDCDADYDSCDTDAFLDMVENYMDYTNDSCMDTFTQNQKDRMVAVMLNSPRRNTLNASTKCQTPAPYIQFSEPTGSVNENTNCNYTDVNFSVTIGKAPTAAATASFAVAGGATATANADYQIMTPTLTFAAGIIATQDLVIRFFHDGITESTENFTVNMTVNANGGDAVLNPNGGSLAVSIIDNDTAPTATNVTTVLTEDFEDATGWTVRDADGDGKNWTLSSGLTGGVWSGLTGAFAASVTDNQIFTGGVGTNPNVDNYIVSPQITIPAGVTAASLSYAIGGYSRAANPTGYREHYYVYFTPNATSPATIQAGTVLENNREIPARASEIRTHNLIAHAGQTGYLVFRHLHHPNGNGMLILDTVGLTATTETLVQTAVNTATQYQATVNQSGMAHAKDATSGKIMASLTSDAFNYGCTSVSVTRDQATAGAAAVNYGTATANNAKVMAKIISVTPATNNAAGNVTIKFYFTDAEITAWEQATGNTRAMLKVIKEGVAVPYTTTLGTFGGNVTLQATFANGLQGNYYFGTDATLSASSFEIVNEVSIYPNPTSDVLNISLPGGFENVKYTIYNSVGQVIRTNTVGRQSDLSFSVSGLSDGIYFVKVEKDGSAKTLRFVKK